MDNTSSAISTIEWLNNVIEEIQSPHQNDNSTPTASTSNASLSIIDDPNPPLANTTYQVNDDGRGSEDELINIADINFNVNTRWKIRGIVSFKYDIRHFNNEHGDSEIFVFDIKDRSGEISITSFNLTARAIEPRIEKDLSYEINNLSIRTANDTYKTLPNNLQLTTTNKTTILEIMPLDVMPISYAFIRLNDLELMELNSVVDIQCRVVRDYGLIAGETNDRRWIKKEIHVMEENAQCRLTLWNNQARLFGASLARKKLKCRYLKVKWFNENTNNSLSNEFFDVQLFAVNVYNQWTIRSLQSIKTIDGCVWHSLTLN